MAHTCPLCSCNPSTKRNLAIETRWDFAMRRSRCYVSRAICRALLLSPLLTQSCSHTPINSHLGLTTLIILCPRDHHFHAYHMFFVLTMSAVISLEATWLLPKHDTIIPQHLTALRLILTQIAEKHDTLHPFVYPNYAGEDQDVFAAIKEGRDGERNMERLRSVQALYDSSGYIARRVAGASKL